MLQFYDSQINVSGLKIAEEINLCIRQYPTYLTKKQKKRIVELNKEIYRLELCLVSLVTELQNSLLFTENATPQELNEKLLADLEFMPTMDLVKELLPLITRLTTYNQNTNGGALELEGVLKSYLIQGIRRLYKNTAEEARP